MVKVQGTLQSCNSAKVVRFSKFSILQQICSNMRIFLFGLMWENRLLPKCTSLFLPASSLQAITFFTVVLSGKNVTSHKLKAAATNGEIRSSEFGMRLTRKKERKTLKRKHWFFSVEELDLILLKVLSFK